MITNCHFTAQREEATLSLYDYRARFYDPLLGRFIQPDSLVPGADDPLAWDRYVYTLNNPVRYTDPSGHMFSVDMDSGVKPEVIAKEIEHEFEWKIHGEWKLEQLFIVWNTAIFLRHSIATFRNDDGINWIRNYLGGTNFYLSIFDFSLAPNEKSVFLPKNFENMLWEGGVNGMILHELAHVLDNRIALESARGARIYPSALKGNGNINGVLIPAVIAGGGPADELYKFAGGTPEFLRFRGGINTPIQNQFGINYSYGNNSSADYFAHAFMVSIIDYSNVPEIARLWMKTYISLLK
uniref:RHS repeat-associated core domain-containing protein n=1 Tax=Bellilinea caldifistulae TaxID=360411 RepID=A0A7C4PXQ2_9CHLR